MLYVEILKKRKPQILPSNPVTKSYIDFAALGGLRPPFHKTYSVQTSEHGVRTSRHFTTVAQIACFGSLGGKFEKRVTLGPELSAIEELCKITIQ